MPGQRQRLAAQGAQHSRDRRVQAGLPDPSAEHVGVHIDANIIGAGPEPRAAQRGHGWPEGARGGISFGDNREPDRYVQPTLLLDGRGRDHPADQRLRGARVGAVARGGDAGEVGLAGHLDRGQVRAVPGHDLGGEAGPSLNVGMGVPVGEHEIPAQPG